MSTTNESGGDRGRRLDRRRMAGQPMRRSQSIITKMVVGMNEAQVRTVEQVRAVRTGTQELEFRAAQDDSQGYAWIESVLRRLA